MDEDLAVPGEETRVLVPMAQRELSIRAGSWNAEARTIEVVFTTGARGARFNWERWEYVDEELATDTANVRLDRINRGAPVLNTHKSGDLAQQIGVVEPGSARMEGGEGVATVRLSARADVEPIVQDIADGIIRNISVGYVVHSYEITENQGQRPLYRAVDWEPYEISFVPMPFDMGAQVRSAEPAQGGFPCIIRRIAPESLKEREMDEDEVQAGATPAVVETRQAPAAPAPQPVQERSQQPAPTPRSVSASDVLTAARNAGLDDAAQAELLDRHADTPLSRDALMADIGRRFAERDAPVSTINRVQITRDEGDTRRRGMEDFLLHRMAPRAELSEPGRAYRGMSLLRMAEEHLSASGVNCRGLAPVEIAERALHSTSDFANLVGNVLNRRLRMAYEENEPTYRRWARRAPNAPDFRNVEVVQLSSMPDLVRTNEGGEFQYGTASDGKVSYGVTTYGRIIGVTRKLIVNDDLRALERVVTGFAGSAARLENRTVYAQITSNPTMPDGVALFHADHGNLGSGVINAANLGLGRAAMRLQKGLQNEELNLMPEFLIAPATVEQLAYQYTSSQFVPAKSSDVNEFRAGGRTALDPVVDAVLDASSTAAWYLAASNSQVDTVEYCYLEGSEGVQVSSRLGFNVDGVEFKASLDFAAAVIDHRGLFKSSGS